MDAAEISAPLFPAIRNYRVHLLIFFIVLTIGLTFAHPEILLTDEWITVNQLHQLNEGHQVLFNEGKYGFTENGTMNAYFAARGNRLAYSLFLPLLSLPALWFVDLFGNHFVFFILYLWIGLLLLIILSLHYFCHEYTFIRKWRWTPAATGVAFILYFINLFYYSPFSVTGPDSFPEAIAVVFTNNILLAIAGVLIYEINRTLFEDPVFSSFGTIVCLFSSSYIFWASGCKDHILTMLFFVAILLCTVRFRKTGDYWYLPLAFVCTGLLAWARPELALWVFFVLCCIWFYAFIRSLEEKNRARTAITICSPFFTLLGALPFFLNNFLITKNPLLPPNTLYFSDEIIVLSSQVSPSLQQGTGIPAASLIRIVLTKFSIGSVNIPGDLYGILFHPQNGSMGVLLITPIFLVMILLAAVLVLNGKIRFSREEKLTMALIAAMAIVVFLAYANNLNQLNISRGINPDIRYLSPVYIPLTLLGLIILRKIPVTSMNPLNILTIMVAFAVPGIPLSIFLTSMAYTSEVVALQLDAPLSAAFSVCIFVLVVLSLIIFTAKFLYSRRDSISGILIAALCALPFIWQIDISVRFWGFAATGQGYPAWIPVIRILYTICSSPLLSH